MKRDKNGNVFFGPTTRSPPWVRFPKAAFVGSNAGLCISRRSAFRKGEEEEEENKDQRLAK